MSQDNMPDIAKKLPPVPPTIPDPSRATALANLVLCESQGGAFVLTFYELRPVEPWTPTDRLEGKSGNVEVSRVVLSPIGFLHLRKALDQAEEVHRQLFGSLPDLDEFTRKVAEKLPDREAKQRMGLRTGIDPRDGA